MEQKDNIHICYRDTEIALTKQAVMNIEKQLDKITKFIDTANSTFATKEEHKENKNAIETVKKELKEIQLQNAKWIGGAVVLSSALGFILNKLF